MKIRLFVIISIFSFTCFANEPKEMPELKGLFDELNVDGSIIIYDQNENLYLGYNLQRCNVAFVPASTFKIANTMIALECGMSIDEKILNVSIQDAFKSSNVPVYQEVSRRIGIDRMRYYTQLFNYGNLDINSDNIDKFWLEGNSVITQYQQIYFLRDLYNLKLPIAEESMEQVKRVMIFETNKNYVMSGKTGWAVTPNEDVVWFVGYVEANNNVYYFATNLVPSKDADKESLVKDRIDLTRNVLKRVGIISE